jgi:hypothetical protein
MFWLVPGRRPVLAGGIAAVHGIPTSTAPAEAGAVGAVQLVANVQPGVPDQDRARVLGPQWATSGDQAWTTAGDADGLHVLTATAASGYTWRTIATLGDPAAGVDRWIGNACVTGSGRRLVVAYAPRTATNRAALLARHGRHDAAGQQLPVPT